MIINYAITVGFALYGDRVELVEVGKSNRPGCFHVVIRPMTNDSRALIYSIIALASAGLEIEALHHLHSHGFDGCIELDCVPSKMKLPVFLSHYLRIAEAAEQPDGMIGRDGQ